MKELAEVLGTLFRKISDLFDIFDLSFFVSGVFVMVPLGIWFHSSPVTAQLRTDLNVWLWLFALTIATYVAGLVCFACGRAARMLVYGANSRMLVLLGRREESKPLSHLLFEQTLERHLLHEHPVVKRYLTVGASGSLYTRAWAKLRETPSLVSSYNHVKRYWIMAATYDGLGFALVVWIMAIWLGWSLKFPLLAGAEISYVFWVSVALGLVVAACFREGSRLVRNQVEELVATLALLKEDELISWVPAPWGTGQQTSSATTSGAVVRQVSSSSGGGDDDEKPEVPPPPKLPGKIKA